MGGPGVVAIGRYDSNLQMFVEEPRDVRRAHLRFLRWLVERRSLEHPVAGPPSGAFAERPSRPVSHRACVPRWFGRQSAPWKSPCCALVAPTATRGPDGANGGPVRPGGEVLRAYRGPSVIARNGGDTALSPREWRPWPLDEQPPVLGGCYHALGNPDHLAFGVRAHRPSRL